MNTKTRTIWWQVELPRSNDIVLRDWVAGTKQIISARGCLSEVAHLAWSPDGRYLAVQPSQGELPCVYDTHTWKPTVRWRLPDVRPFLLALAADGTLLALLGNGELHSLDPAWLDAPTD